MKILNLYAGIGGNRKLWGNEHEITAVEFDSAIARAYKDRFPYDNLIVADAKDYLLHHYREFDFIWASPPCQSHSRARKCKVDCINNKMGINVPVFPDLSLYEIIIFLKHHCRNKFVVENVKPYYKPLIFPSVTIDRHIYWSNFHIYDFSIEKKYKIQKVNISSLTDFDISKYKDIKNKQQVIRNQVDYEIGKHILECALNSYMPVQLGLFDVI